MIGFVNFPAFKRRMTKTVPAAITKAASFAMEKGATELVDEMKRVVPEDTGDLRDSIGWTWGEGGFGTMTTGSVNGRPYETLRVTVFAGNTEATRRSNPTGPAFDVALIKEFGTTKAPASPFFYTSYRGLRKKIKANNTRAITKAIRGL